MDEMSAPTIVDDYGNASAADQCHSHFSLNNWFEKLERLMKNTAWIIIIISASVHFKRLFQSGRFRNLKDFNDVLTLLYS